MELEVETRRKGELEVLKRARSLAVLVGGCRLLQAVLDFLVYWQVLVHNADAEVMQLPSQAALRGRCDWARGIGHVYFCLRAATT